jgi:poly-beta-hydroxybutyrate-responsive repressor
MESMKISESEACADSGRCACEGGTLERLVRPALLVILTGGELHGYKIVQQLAEMPMFDGHTPNASGVYRTLKLMYCEGLVTSAWEQPDGGPARIQYSITEAGRHCLAVWIETLTKYRDALNGLLDSGRDALGEC